MVRLSTQPDQAHVLSLRSGFYALPLANSQQTLFVRLHHSHSEHGYDDDDEGRVSAVRGSNQLFVTGLPLGVSEKGIKAALNKVWGGGQGDDGIKVKKVELLPAPPAAGGVYSLYQQELALAVAAGDEVPGIAHLLDVSSFASTSTAVPSPPSAIVTFSSSPSLPPPPYAASTPLNLPPAPSFLAASAARHAAARPHRSVVTAHADEWMRAYDARKLAAARASYTPPEPSISAAAKKAKKNKKGKGTADVGPLPGSAAEALAKHAAFLAQREDKSFNPDAEDDGEWTTVTRGGKHGTSLLPTGVVPTVSGYGGVSVKVAGKKRGRAAEEGEEKNDAGIRQIVGEGFYRFNKAEGKKRELTDLKRKFEEDKARVDRLREGGFASRGRGGGGRGRGRGGGSGGREGRSFKPY
ncbi:hypothetical protein JCM8547_004124 [Rhodosporidiobolus lusitaniae]